MKAQNKGFTLVELLVSFVIVIIVIGTITMGVHSGVSLFSKTKAHGELLTGARHTAECFDRVIAPHMNFTESVKILNNPTIPASSTLQDDECYVFLSKDILMYRTKKGTFEFDGSDKITGVTFSVTKDSDGTSASNTLTVTLSADDKMASDTKARTSLAIRKSLFSEPDRTGNVVGSLLSGNVLYFRSESVLVDMMRIIDKNTNREITSIKKSGTESQPVVQSWDMSPRISPLTQAKISNDLYADAFMSLTAKQPQRIELKVSPSATTKTGGCWRLVTSTGGYLSANSVDAKDSFNLGYTHVIGGGNKETWNYGVLWYASLLNPATANYSMTRRQQHDFTPIHTAGTSDTWAASKYPFWSKPLVISSTGALASEWFSAITRGEVGDRAGDDFVNVLPTVTDLYSYINSNDGRITITLAQKGAGPAAYSPGVALAAKIRPELLRRERELKRYEKTAYTTVTNYSVIVDAEVSADGGQGGYAILLNARRTTERVNINRQFYGYGVYFHVGNQYLGVHLFKNESNSGSEMFNGEYYGIQQEALSRDKNSNGERLKLYLPPKRVMYTVLEYYMNGKKEEPYFIIRARLLYPKPSITPNDNPWGCGKDYIYGEPIWFGGYVGDAPTKNGTEYDFTVKNYSTYNGDKISRRTLSNTLDRSRYVMKFYNHAYRGTTTYKGTWDGIFRGRALDVTRQNEDSEGSSGLYNVSTVDRYIALRAWGPKTGRYKVDFKEIDLAPGFSPAELKAIMPENASVYEVSDTAARFSKLTKAEKDYLYSYNNDTDENLNKALFGGVGYSKGNGNGGTRIGVMDIQHVLPNAFSGPCTCPLCQNE